jgi:hypothetical protein
LGKVLGGASIEMSIYSELREKALQTTSGDIGINLTNEQQVYAGIIDIYAGNATATLVCMFDGTVSVYYSNGRAAIGLGEQQKIKKTAMNFLFNAGQCLEKLHMTENTDITVDKGMRIYLKALNGIYTIALEPNRDMDKVGKFLNFLIQNVLSEIRNSQEQTEKHP